MTSLAGPAGAADCSSYIGDATVNEVRRSGGGEDAFIEVKLLDTDIPESVYGEWTLSYVGAAQGDNRNTLTDKALTEFNSDGFPWLILPASELVDEDDMDFRNNRDGLEIRLDDSNGNAIDYLSVGGFEGQFGADCAFDYETTMESTNSFSIFRLPDGTGEWGTSGSGNSGGDPTQGDANDPDGGGGGRGLDHYAISHSGTLVSCNAETVTITGHNAGDQEFDPGTVTVDLSTTTNEGTWTAVLSGSGTLNDATAGDGEASYTFPGNGEASVDLEFHYTSVTAAEDPETTSINVQDANGATEDGTEDPDLTVSRSGFRFTDGAGNAVNVPTQIAAKPSNTAPGGQSLALQAIETSSSEPTQCVPAFPDGTTVEVGLAGECRDPATCAGNELAVTNDGTTTAVDTSDDNAGSGAASYEPVELLFGADAEAAITLSYPDAGAIQLHARHDAIDDSGDTPTVVPMTGASNEFVVRPFGFFVDFDPDADDTFDDRAANSACADQISCAADADGDVFATAAVDFPVYLKAVVWEDGDDRDDDGVPDTNQVIAGNALTPNFGDEASPETVDFSRTLVAPSGGSAGSLSGAGGIGGFNGGETIATGVAWNEVGIIDLGANLSDNDYLDSGVDVTGTAPNLGRFKPADFVVSVRDPGMYAATCSGMFSYVGEAFGYDVRPRLDITARNADEATTGNYRGGFIKLDATGVAVTPSNVDGEADGNVSGTNDVAVTPSLNEGSIDDDGDEDALGNGVVVYSFASGDTYTYDKVHNARIEAFTSDLPITVDDVTDGDGVTDASLPSPNPFTPTGVEIRFGRLVIDDAFGPEVAPVEQRWRIEYWQGANWAINGEDSCTSFALNSDVELTGDGGSAPGGTTVTLMDSGGTGTTEITSGAVDFASGTATVVYDEPGAGERGWIGVASTLGPDHHLLIDDNDDGGEDGPYDANPAARVTFGVFAGESENIYLREVFPSP